MRRDFQRSRVYAWERSLPDWNDGAPDASPRPMALADCERLARRAAQHYGVVGFRVRDGRGARFARGGMRGIKLPVWARQPVVVLHETAHMIAARRGLADGHGPVFMRLFVQLLATYAGQDEAALIRSARAQRVKVAGRQPVRWSPGGR